MALGEVLREFGVKVSLAFDGKKIDEAENKIRKFGGEMRSFALEAAGMTAALFESQNLFTSNARSLSNQADMLHLNTDELQEYEYAAKVAANANREDLVASLQTLGDTMDKARAGMPEARQALFNMANAAGRGQEMMEKLQDPMFKVTDAASLLSDGIAKMSANNPQAARRMTELAFGSDKLYNLWRQGPKALSQLTKEADKNFVLNQKMIAQGKAMDIQMSKLWMIFRKFGYEIGFSVMKHLAPMIDQFQKWFAANKQIIASGINGFLDTMADGLQFLFTTAVKVVEILKPFINYLGGAESAVHKLVLAFLVFKAISLAGSILSLVANLGGLLAPVMSIATGMASVASGAGAAVSAIAAIGPAIAVAGAALAGFEIGKILNDKINDMTGGEGIGGKIYDWLHPSEAALGSTVTPSAGAGSNSSSTIVNQENHFNTTTTVTVPHGTTAHAATAMVSKANIDAHEEMMRKAQSDSARSRVY